MIISLAILIFVKKIHKFVKKTYLTLKYSEAHFTPNIENNLKYIYAVFRLLYYFTKKNKYISFSLTIKLTVLCECLIEKKYIILYLSKSC